MRTSGILMPVFSLPSKYGIGCFSKEAYQFVDFLKESGQKNWQVLPLGQTSYGDSPYQSFSSFAGNPYFIDLEQLVEQQLLTKAECDSFDFGKNPESIDYAKLYQNRYKILRMACDRFLKQPSDDFFDFCQENDWWLGNYALFMVIKNMHKGASWLQWEEKYKRRDFAALDQVWHGQHDEIQFYQFQQYLFFCQWKKLHAYAAQAGIQIIGDIPIYVALDSADAWAEPQLFQFDEELKPAAVAGCPPDAFSATGQLWGNPLYDWSYHKKTGYAWWIRRIAQCLNLYDCIRIDHFRGFDEYYSIPAGDETAEHGHWEPGPGMDLMHVLKDALGDVNVIAEDLGFLTDGVRRLLHDSGFPGMKVIQFAFDSREESDYLPHNYEKNCVVYTGTHDNDTVMGWMKTAPKASVKFATEYLNLTEEEGYNWGMMRAAWSSVADMAIVPMQDLIGLGSEARINIPSTLGENWKWRALEGQITKDLAKKLYKYMQMYGRISEKVFAEQAKKAAEKEAAKKKTSDKKKSSEK